MRVAFIGEEGEGGHARYCMSLAAALRGEGAEVFSVAKHKFPTPAYTRLGPLWAADRLARVVRDSFRAASAVRRLNPEVVHHQVVVPIVDQLWMPRAARRVPIVMTLHNVVHHDSGIEMHPAFMTRVLRSVAAIIVHSEVNREAVLRVYRGLTTPVEVVPLGAWLPSSRPSREEARRSLGLPLDSEVVLFFGRIRRNKGLSRLIDAFRILRERREKVLLAVAGELPVGETFQPYRDQMEGRGVWPSVRAEVGFIPDERAASYYAAADVVALPYDSDFNAQSGVLLDAYGHGRPVVVTNAGGIGEAVTSDGAGIVAPSYGAEDYAHALGALLDDPNLRREMGDRVVRLAQSRYSWEAVARQTLAVYKRAIESSGAGR